MRAEMGKDPTRAPPSQLNLPAGFRFCPTDDELIVHYLCRKAACEPFPVPIIAEVELYKFDPWDLPEKALFGEKEWYFFSPRDRKYPNGSRPNRAAGTGYWKATGTDKPIGTVRGSKKVGVKKALVFYKGKPPKGIKTNWIMHEYRLAECGAPRSSAKRKSSLRLDDWVLCRIYKKSSSAAADQMKQESDLDVKGERSDSSGFNDDDVMATLSALDDPTDEVGGAAEPDQEACTDMQLDTVYRQEGSGQGLSADLSAYMREFEAAGIGSQGATGGDGRSLPPYGNDGGSTICRMLQRHQAETPESNESSRQHSALESVSVYSTTDGLKQEEEDLTVESTFNALSKLPLTQLLSTGLNTGFPTNPLLGFDLGLPSPCTMLAQGGSFGDNYLFEPSHFGWDPSKATFFGQF